MIGEILDAKYRIDKQLGAGGMGNVYLATHLGTTRIVAVKVIAPRWAAEPQFLSRFQREAQACGRLRHPNIVNVTDFGIARGPGGDMPYLVMEYLDGQTLSDFQNSHPNPPLPLVADILDQIGLALEDAHGHGIVHRDLKPDNIWLEPNGRGGYTVKVLDFGVAKVNLIGVWVPRERVSPTPVPAAVPAGEETALEVETVAMAGGSSGASSGSFDSSAGGHTMPGSLVGTPAYMSPEQALGQEIDFRSDIYSLAVVAYSLVCGVLPFRGKTNQLIEFHQAGSPIPPARLRKIPGDVSDAIIAGLARDPADRPPSALAFTRRFHNAVDAEFLALRRSKAFMLQHLAAYTLLLMPIYTGVLTLTGLMMMFRGRLPAVEALRIVFIPLASAVLFIFADNALRAAAALIALDEQAGLRRFLSFRVWWKLTRMLPVLAMTQARALVYLGPGWVIGDALWAVVVVVEKLRGTAALRRSRELMTGLRSAGRALAIRHLALAAFAVAEALKAAGLLWRQGRFDQPNSVATGAWFPLFALYAAAPLFLYDRTAGNVRGPLLQLDRTPELRTSARALSPSSIAWLAAGALYLLYQPIELWLSRGH